MIVPHLALGSLGIAVVLVWRMAEFAVVLFFRTLESRLSVGGRIGGSARIGEEAGMLGSGKMRAVKGAIVGLRIGCRRKDRSGAG